MTDRQWVMKLVTGGKWNLRSCLVHETVSRAATHDWIESNDTFDYSIEVALPTVLPLLCRWITSSKLQPDRRQEKLLHCQQVAACSSPHPLIKNAVPCCHVSVSSQCPQKGCYDCPKFSNPGDNPYFQKNCKTMQHTRAQHFMENGDADAWRKTAEL